MSSTLGIRTSREEDLMFMSALAISADSSNDTTGMMCGKVIVEKPQNSVSMPQTFLQNSSKAIMGFGPIRTSTHTFEAKPVKPSKPFSDMKEDELYAHIKLATSSIIIVGSAFITQRFNDIICPKDSRVGSIHANYINKDSACTEANKSLLTLNLNLEEEIAFIASQAPIRIPTKEKLIQEYWRSIVDNSDIIIDLTTQEEIQPFGTEDTSKVTPYYPQEEGETLHFSDELSVKLETSEEIEGFGVLHTYEVVCKASSVEVKKEISRLHFNGWKDFSIVSISLLENIISKIDVSKRHFIHCRAGVGRTGTLIVAYYLKAKIEKGLVTKENLNEYIYNLIITLRMQRGPHFVQNQSQFNMIMSYAKSLLSN